MTWIDVAGFWVSVVGTAASTVIAIVAVTLSITTARAANRRAARASREEWVRDFNVWLDAGRVHMMTGGETAIADRSWVERGDQLSARAQVHESQGANEYLRAARAAREHLRQMRSDPPPERQKDLAMYATSVLKLWAIDWVDDPSQGPGDIIQWIESLPEREGN